MIATQKYNENVKQMDSPTSSFGESRGILVPRAPATRSEKVHANTIPPAPRSMRCEISGSIMDNELMMEKYQTSGVFEKLLIFSLWPGHSPATLLRIFL